MNITLTSDNLLEIASDATLLAVTEEETNTVLNTLVSSDFLTKTSFTGKRGELLLLTSPLSVRSPFAILVGLGKASELNHEAFRVAFAKGIRKVRSLKLDSVAISLNQYPMNVAEGVFLGLYRFDTLLTQNKESRHDIKSIILSGNETSFSEWNKGVIFAEAQNNARFLGEMPSNIATPSYFVQKTKELFEGIGQVTIEDHDENWAKEQKMGAFLSVAKGSDEPAKFLIVNYKGNPSSQNTDVAYVGKGITFDTGGISIKPSSGMGAMRGDCTGAAVAISTVYGIAKLGLNVNVVSVTPLTENMPGGHATKPSDVVFASNGKSIEVDNTDAEGRMILSDALVFTEQKFAPNTVIDIATLTGAMMIALGEHYVGAFTNSDSVWEQLKHAGELSGEMFWRMPLDTKYSKQLESTVADLKNTGGRPAGSITAAMFLSEFVENENWVHLDIAGVTWPSNPVDYKPKKGNVGMPVRALITFSEKLTS